MPAPQSRTPAPGLSAHPSQFHQAGGAIFGSSTVADSGYGRRLWLCFGLRAKLTQSADSRGDPHLDFPDVTATLQWTGSQDDARYLWALYGREETQTQTQAHASSGRPARVPVLCVGKSAPTSQRPAQPAQDMGKSDADKTNCDLTL